MVKITDHGHRVRGSIPLMNRERKEGKEVQRRGRRGEELGKERRRGEEEKGGGKEGEKGEGRITFFVYLGSPQRTL